VRRYLSESDEVTSCGYKLAMEVLHLEGDISPAAKLDAVACIVQRGLDCGAEWRDGRAMGSTGSAIMASALWLNVMPNRATVYPNRRTQPHPTCTSCTDCVLACCNAHSCACACGLAQGVREDALLALARDLLQRGLDPNAPAVERTTRASAATFIVAGALQHPRSSVHFKDRAPPADGRRSP